MTTAVWDGETLAADTLMCTGGAITSLSTKKIFTLTTGEFTAFAIAGDYGANSEVKRLLSSGEKSLISLPDTLDIAVLAVNSSGCFYLDTTTYCPIKSESYEAIGSGCKYALGAMHCGASASEALKAAMSLDPYTGGDIMSFNPVSKPYLIVEPRRNDQ
jgi:hypothetical protein